MSTHTSTTHWLLLLTVLTGTLFLFAPSHQANAQSPTNVDAALGSTFNYQGRLNDGGNPATGSFDFQFILYDAASGGSQKGSTLKVDKVAVGNGLFNVPLDFGQAVIDGTALFLEVGVKPAGSASTYTVLSPRTGLNAVPYALGMPGVTVQNNDLYVKGWLTVGGTDLIMGPNERGNGGRALVHDVEDTLVLNWGNDFAGGVRVDSGLRVYGLTVYGGISMDGADFVMSPNANGDGGRAVTHDVDDTLVLNWGNDFSGGVRVDSSIRSYGLTSNGDIHVINGSFIDDGTTLNVPDYVFEKDYKLMPLDELAAFLAKEKHLPGVPSQAEIRKNGLNMSQFNMHLLEKVEELTLYTLAQQKQIDAQQQQINDLAARLAKLEQ